MNAYTFEFSDGQEIKCNAASILEACELMKTKSQMLGGAIITCDNQPGTWHTYSDGSLYQDDEKGEK